jgi:membrane-bound lytic murein transglycosylase B
MEFLMIENKKLTTATFLILAMLACLSPHAYAAQCGNGPAGFEAWKSEFTQETRAKGVGGLTVQALMATNYASATMAADRGQRSLSLSLD